MIIFNEQNRSTTILLVDDDAVYRRDLEDILSQSGHHVTSYATGTEALQAGYFNDFDLALLNIRLPDMSGIDLARRLSPLPVFFISQHSDQTLVDSVTTDEDVNQNLVGYIIKAADNDKIDVTINAAIRVARVLRNKQLLLASSTKALEEEKRALARELHDQLGQMLVQAKWDALAIRNWPEEDIDIALIKEKANRVIQAIEQVYSTTNTIIEQLRPEDLDTLGLKRAIERMVEQWRLRESVCKYHLTIDGPLIDVEESIKVSVYRIVQESLTNIAKHADANNVEVTIHEVPGESIVLQISDDGKGFVSEEVSPTRHGLIGMRERAAGLGGKLTIESVPGKGTTIYFAIRYAPRSQLTQHDIRKASKF